MNNQLLLVVATLAALLVSGCDGSNPVALPSVITLVNSLEDLADPPAGTLTLRAALEAAAPGEAIRFDPSLDGGVIELSIVGDEHSVLTDDRPTDGLLEVDQRGVTRPTTGVGDIGAIEVP